MSLPPLTFSPYLRPQIWGGRQLEALNKQLPTEADYGESWELSCHPHHVSEVVSGKLAGASLQKLISEQGDQLLGKSYARHGFPLLIKYLDCHRLLSVQVHPTDALAEEIIGNESGKTEAWVVLKAEPSAKIYAGLKAGVTRAEFESAMAAGTVEDCLHSFVPKPGDCIFIPAGTVHAMGGGVLIAEVQQTSDATFRLFDWNRLDTTGKPRQLHVAESLKSIDWNAGPVAPVVPQALPGMPSGVHGELLVDCNHFRLERIQLHEKWTQPISTWHVAMVVNGSVELTASQLDHPLKLQTGETALIPASVGRCEWSPIGDATLLFAWA